MRQLAILTAILTTGVIMAGAPITWDVRFGDSSSVSQTKVYKVYTQLGDTTDLMPRLFDRGRAAAIESNALVRAYFREYGTTNAFTASAATGTVFQTASDKGRVKVRCYDSDYAATTNEFYVGIDYDGYIYSARGILEVLGGPGIAPTTATNGWSVIDWSKVDNINTTNAPFATTAEVNAITNLLTGANIIATLVTNSTYTITISD